MKFCDFMMTPLFDTLVGPPGHQCNGRGHGQVQTQALPAHRCGMYLSLSLPRSHAFLCISLLFLSFSFSQVIDVSCIYLCLSGSLSPSLSLSHTLSFKHFLFSITIKLSQLIDMICILHISLSLSLSPYTYQPSFFSLHFLFDALLSRV